MIVGIDHVLFVVQIDTADVFWSLMANPALQDMLTAVPVENAAATLETFIVPLAGLGSPGQAAVTQQ